MLVALMRTIRLFGMVFPALIKSLIILCSLVGIQCVTIQNRQTEPLQIFLRPAAFKKLCTLLRTLLRMIVKKKGARRLPILIKFLEKTKSIRT
jgi:hypothetical protein